MTRQASTSLLNDKAQNLNCTIVSKPKVPQISMNLKNIEKEMESNFKNMSKRKIRFSSQEPGKSKSGRLRSLCTSNSFMRTHANFEEKQIKKEVMLMEQKKQKGAASGGGNEEEDIELF